MFLCYCLFAIGDTSKSLLCKKMLVEEVVVLVCRSCASHRQVDPRKKVDPYRDDCDGSFFRLPRESAFSRERRTPGPKCKD